MTTIQAIDLLKGLEQSLDGYCELNDEGKTAFRMAITALELFGNAEQLPSAQPHWIPCSERLPKYPYRVQIQLDNGWIITGYYSEGHWYTVPHCGGFLRNDEVEAWRELPELYGGSDAK